MSSFIYRDLGSTAGFLPHRPALPPPTVSMMDKILLIPILVHQPLASSQPLHQNVDCLDEQDMRTLDGLPKLRGLWLCARSTQEVVLNTTASTDDAAPGHDCFFPKLTWCRVQYTKLPFQPKGVSGAVTLRGVLASMLLGSDVWSGKSGVAPCLASSSLSL